MNYGAKSVNRLTRIWNVLSEEIALNSYLETLTIMVYIVDQCEFKDLDLTRSIYLPPQRLL